MKSRKVSERRFACTNSVETVQKGSAANEAAVFQVGFRTEPGCLRGSATVEAAITLPIVMFAFLAVLSIIRIAVTYERMQQALNQVSCQLSQYSYLYAISGLKDRHDEFNKEIKEAAEEFKKQQEVFTSFYGEMQSITESVSKVDFSDISSMESILSLADNINMEGAADSYKALTEQIENIMKDPVGEMRLIGLALSENLFSKGKTLLFGELSKYMIKQNLARDMQIPPGEVDERLRLSGVIDELDMSCSTFFNDNETIDLIVEYTVKPVPDFKFLPEIRLRNRSCVLAWTWGVERVKKSSESKEQGSDTIWNIDSSKKYVIQHFGRGNKVDKWFAEELKNSIGDNAEVTPYHFKTVDLIEYSKSGKDGALYTIFSLNPFLPSYAKKSGVVGEIKKNIHKLNEFKKYEVSGFTIDITGYEKNYRKIVYIVIPENPVLPDAYLEAFEECRHIAERLGMELRQIQKYGEYTEVDDGKEQGKEQ